MGDSVDAYYRYNVQNAKSSKNFNNLTSFTHSQNSIELGLVSLRAGYAKEKTEVLVDVGLSLRETEFSYSEVGILQAIKQAFAVFEPNKRLRICVGKCGIHVGYEVIDPQLNRNYSMSYMFSYGPFSHTGIKADWALGSGFGLMVGITQSY